MGKNESRQQQTPQQGEIILYQPDETVRLEVRLEDETVWLTQAQMAELFGRDRSVIGKHISNCFREKELEPDVVCAKFAQATTHGAIKGKVQVHDVTFYNLDVIISVGYRVKSVNGTRFRQWATSVLKRYILQGAAVNRQIHFVKEEIDNRLAKHDQQIQTLQEKIDFFVRTNQPPVEGGTLPDTLDSILVPPFYDGQIFDAYRFVSDLVRKARRSIALIDNYVDDTVLTMLNKRADGVTATIYTQHISPQFQLDIDRHNGQYAPIVVEHFNRAHDRFLLVDDEVYHIGASLKDLGRRWFAFTLMHDLTANELISRISGSAEED